jgi:hypothetical protein
VSESFLEARIRGRECRGARRGKWGVYYAGEGERDPGKGGLRMSLVLYTAPWAPTSLIAHRKSLSQSRLARPRAHFSRNGPPPTRNWTWAGSSDEDTAKRGGRPWHRAIMRRSVRLRGFGPDEVERYPAMVRWARSIPPRHSAIDAGDGAIETQLSG